MRRALASAVLAAVAAWPGASPAGKRFIVAIMDMEARDVRLAAGQREKLTIYLGTAIAETGAFRVVPRSETKRALERLAAASHRECYDDKCQIELGRELAADKNLASTVMRLGKQCVLSVRLYDLESQTTDITAKARGGCDEAGLVDSISRTCTAQPTRCCAESEARSRPDASSSTWKASCCSSSESSQAMPTGRAATGPSGSPIPSRG